MRILVFSWFLLLPLFQILLRVNIALVSGQCLEDQRSLLFQLKNGLQFNSSLSTKLVSWDQNTDCCSSWGGVTCSQDGLVTGLDLNNESISGGINSSTSLFSLQYLQKLNLAFNSFNSTPIPSGLANLTSLTYLNLSSSGFAGQIPNALSRMTRLVTLDLSILYFPGVQSLQLENPNLGMLVQNLTELTQLYLDGVNISANRYDWCQAISSSLPNLRVLSLSSCYISGPIDSSLLKLPFLSVIRLDNNNLSAPIPKFFANFTNLTTLRLSSCSLNGVFPEKILQLPTLKILDLTSNILLCGTLPEFPQNGSLETLVISHTNFSGPLPKSMGNLKMLSRMELTQSNFSGSIPNSMANLTYLVYLDMSSNMFTGPIPSFQKSRNLTHIDLSRNKLSGPIPTTHFEGLSRLAYIDLRFNSFIGNIPLSLFTLPSLQKIQLSNNQFNGQIAEFSIVSSSLLDTLDLSSNRLEGSIPMSFFHLKWLKILSLSFNKLNGTIQLETFHTLGNLTSLDLSYNNLSIETSGNNSGLTLFPQITTLKLASCKMKFFPNLENQSRLFYLDLSDNKIGGQIPNWIWKVDNVGLTYLNLSRNLLQNLEKPYVIPGLIVLDLHSNRLRGELPMIPQSASYVDYSTNYFSSSIPADIGNNLTSVNFFSVSNNHITGTIPESICNATYLQVLDLSSNNLSGVIPTCLIERIGTLGVLNLGNNNLEGNIPGSFLNHCGLKTLDLHGNLLEGKVPESLANCGALEVLNLGNNRIKDIFPCFLKNSSNLRVLVLRSNMFYGGIHCRGANKSWPNLQIIDIASNNFSGDLIPRCFLNWKAMMHVEDGAESEFNHLRFKFLQLNNFYYQDTVTVTNKGLEMELVKILTLFTSIDVSNNSFEGNIPATIGELKALYVLNLSHNAFTGSIPPSIGNLIQLGSLDLSMNNLNGSIPPELSRLTFLSFLNLSNNQLAGRIPEGRQLQTFTETSFEGNKGLCGFQLNVTCGNPESVPPLAPNSDSSSEFDWQFIYTGMGFGVGAGMILGPLMFWKQGRRWWDDYTDKLIVIILSVFGLVYTRCDDVKVEPEENIEEEHSNNAGESDDNEDEFEDKSFQGRYCVFCSKLDIFRKKVIHDLTCSCHNSTPIVSSSFYSSYSTSESQPIKF